ncbi:MAG: site-specific integrase, partial [Pseudomonadota bacterium]
MALSLDVAVQQFLDHVKVERELTPATVAAYGCDLAAFCRFAAKRGVRTAVAVRAIDVLEHLAKLTDDGLTARSQARRLVAVRQLFRFLKAERICDTNPTEDVDLPRFGRKLPDFLSVEEVDLLLAAPDRRTDRGLRDAAMLETLYATGLRVSELVKLRLRDVNFDAGYLLAFGKGRKERLVPVGEVAIGGLRTYVETGRAVFTGGRALDTLFLT